MFALYGMPISVRSWKVRWALEEARAPYRFVSIDILRGENRAAEFLRVNPRGTVPALVHGELTLLEANAMLVYIAEQVGGPLAIPEGSERARTLQWLFFDASSLGEPVHLAWLCKYFAGIGRPYDTAAHARALDESAGPLRTLDAHLAGREHVTGAFGIADIALAASISQCAEAEIDLEPHPHVRAWLDRVTSRPAYTRAVHPPEAP